MEAAAQMAVSEFFGRDGLRFGGLPYLTAAEGDRQPKATTRPDGRTTDEALTEIAHRFNAFPAMLAALEAAKHDWASRGPVDAEGARIYGMMSDALALARGEVK